MLYLASDHAGFYLKEKIKKFLKLKKIKFIDVGPHQYDENDDYPDYIIPAAKKVAKNPKINQGIILGGSGQGEAITANKVKGIRAALYYGGPQKIIVLAKKHNQANILSLGARFLNSKNTKRAIKLWLETPSAAKKRHLRRIKKIHRYEVINSCNINSCKKNRKNN